VECKIQVQVHAHWSDNAPGYRIYVDNDLLTERTFGWISYQYYILENIICELNDGSHTLKLQNLDKKHSRFELTGLTVNGKSIDSHLYATTESELLWNFTIDTLVQN